MPPKPASTALSTLPAYLSSLNDPRKPLILALCDLIPTAAPGITGEIKWNAPSFRLQGKDHFATLRIPPKSSQPLQLILHTGAKKSSTPQNLKSLLPDPASILTWPAPDRALLSFNLPDLHRQQAPLLTLLQLWIKHL